MPRPTGTPRQAALLLCALVAFGVLAAPAPSYKPKPSKVWVEGWGKPVDLTDGYCFVPKGKELTVTLPAANRQTYVDDRLPLQAPRLLRHVRGDFVMEVRLRVAFRPEAVATRQAGIVLICGEKGAALRRGLSMALPVPGPVDELGPRWQVVSGSCFDESGTCCGGAVC